MTTKTDHAHFEMERMGSVRTLASGSPDAPLVFSYGAGLDSWFVTTRLLESDAEPWVSLRRRLVLIIHANLGAELPQTTGHLWNVAMPFMQEHGWDLTVIKPLVIDKNGEFHTDLRSYLEAQGVVPSRTSRWCSQRFKIVPIQHAAQTILGVPHDTLLGYDAAEGHRTARLSQKQKASMMLPLMQLGLDRLAMRRMLLEEGWPLETVPIKSRCSFCIFSKVAELEEIERTDPEILEADIVTEEKIIAANGRKEFTFLHRSLRAIRDDIRRRMKNVQGSLF